MKPVHKLDELEIVEERGLAHDASMTTLPVIPSSLRIQSPVRTRFCRPVALGGVSASATRRVLSPGPALVPRQP